MARTPHPIGYDAKGGCILFLVLFVLTVIFACILVLAFPTPEEPEYGWSRHTEKGKKWDAEHR
jgi:hypothetical protein